MAEPRKFEVSNLAHELWERGGCPHGEHLRHSFEAERLVQDVGLVRQLADLDEGLIETFPASDPPAALMRARKAS